MEVLLAQADCDHLPRDLAALLTLVGGLVGALLLGETISPIGYVGCGLMFTAMLMVELVPEIMRRRTIVEDGAVNDPLAFVDLKGVSLTYRLGKESTLALADASGRALDTATFRVRGAEGIGLRGLGK